MYVVCLLFYAIGDFCFSIFLYLSFSIFYVSERDDFLFRHQLALDAADVFIISYRSGSYAVAAL